MLVVLAPVDVWSAGAAGTVEDVGWADAFEHFHHAFTVFHPHCCRRDRLALAFQELVQMSSDPAIAAPDQEGLRDGVYRLEGGLSSAVGRVNLLSSHLVRRLDVERK